MKLNSFLIIFVFCFAIVAARAETLDLTKIPTISSPRAESERLGLQNLKSASEMYDDALAGLNENSGLNNEEINLSNKDFPDSSSKISPEKRNIVDNQKFSRETAHSLSYGHSEKLYEDIELLAQNGEEDLAIKKSLEYVDWLDQAIDGHFTLYKIFKDNNQIESSQNEKNLALSFARLRDQTLFLIANVYIKREKLKDAIEPLVKIVQSQPDSEIAKKAYKKLQEIGFTF